MTQPSGKKTSKSETEIITGGDSVQKKKALDSAMSQIEKQFGKGSIMKLSADSRLDVHVIPTGSLSLDLALGVGGIPQGRVVEIYGPEAGGKTTLAQIGRAHV